MKRITYAIVRTAAAIGGALDEVSAGPASTRLRSALTADQGAVTALTAVAACAYGAFSLIRFRDFKTSSVDLVMFDQAVRSYAAFGPGQSILDGLHSGIGPNASILGDHFSPIVAVLAPLYWIAPGPQTLLLAQAALFALAIPPLWLFTRRALGGGRPGTMAAYLVAVAYALSWPVAAAVSFDFHETAFVPVLTAVALERLGAGRLRGALLALGALLLVKEDMGLFVAGFGLYLAAARYPVVSRQRLMAVSLAGTGLAYTGAATYFLIPAFGGLGSTHWAYPALGADVPHAVLHVLAHPASTLWLLGTPTVKLTTVAWLLGTFCFLPLASPISLAAIPILLERMLGTTFPNWWQIYYHYNAYLVVVLCCAAVDGAVRAGRLLERVRVRRVAGDARLADIFGTGTIALGCTWLIGLAAVFLVPVFAYSEALSPAFYQVNAQIKAAGGAVATVPPGVTVEAINNLGPQLSGSDTVELWDGRRPFWAPWVVADVARPVFMFTSVPQQRDRVALLGRHGYRVVYDRDGYLVLHRAGPAVPRLPEFRQRRLGLIWYRSVPHGYPY